MRSDTAFSLQYIEVYLEDAIIPVTLDTSSDGAPCESIIDH